MKNDKNPEVIYFLKTSHAIVIVYYIKHLDLPLDSIWNIYNTRSDCENRIKELKQDFGLKNFCLKNFWATESSFRFIMGTYNIKNLFRFFALQSNRKSTLSTLKIYCFALGAWTVKHANKKVLTLHCLQKKSLDVSNFCKSEKF